MRRAKVCLIIAVAIALVLFALAFLIAPHACPRGYEIYFWCAVVAVCFLLALPFVTRAGPSMVTRTGVAIGLAVLAACGWLAGMIAANVRFICGMGYL